MIRKAPIKETTETKTMKTKILSLAVTAVAAISLSPVAFARPDFPVKRATSGASARGAFIMQSEVCKGVDCCTTKWVAHPALGGRASHSSFKKVRACNDKCAVPVKDKRLVCRKGYRA